MPHALNLHPASSCTAVEAIDVEVRRQGETFLALHYRLAGNLAGLRLPDRTSSERRDGLWQRTCFEAFLRPPGEAAYIELNFAPSTQWAGYGFTGYRQGMAPVDIAPPEIRVASTETILTIDTHLQWAALADCQIWRLALSAVIEEIDGNKSYWALAHPPGDPDFHHSDCFAAELPIAEGS